MWQFNRKANRYQFCHKKKVLPSNENGPIYYFSIMRPCLTFYCFNVLRLPLHLAWYPCLVHKENLLGYEEKEPNCDCHWILPFFFVKIFVGVYFWTYLFYLYVFFLFFFFHIQGLKIIFHVVESFWNISWRGGQIK